MVSVEQMFEQGATREDTPKLERLTKVRSMRDTIIIARRFKHFNSPAGKIFEQLGGGFLDVGLDR